MHDGSVQSPSPDVAASAPFLPPSRSDRLRPSSSWFLIIQANVWRWLARFGFYLHTFPKPSPPKPSFFKTYTTTGASGKARSPQLQLAFYVPPDYHREIKRGRRYPVVVNFHGGGFTLGRPSDDARWAAALLGQLSAVVVVTVTYRLAPEHPFPAAVEDGVAALLYLSADAEALGLDWSRVTLSGFSAGGNLAFTVPLLLAAQLRARLARQHHDCGNKSAVVLPPQIISIIAWYPSIDNRLTRTQRRAASLRPSKTLPSVLTHLFDASYFPNPDRATNVHSPYASPAAATDEDLRRALPDDVALFLCEWDMLLQEGRDFAARLEGLGKRVRCEVVTERGHGFDKHPWPFGLDWKARVHYRRACEWLGEVLGRSMG